MRAASLDASTFTLKDPSGNAVPSTVSYDASTNVATLSPSVALQYGTVYRAVLPANGAKDLGGNALAADAETVLHHRGLPAAAAGRLLERQPLRPLPDEILRNEGLDAFTTLDTSLLSASVLSNFDVVLLGDGSLSAAQVATLTSWVNAGGNLIAMHPDKQLAGLLGLSDAGTTLSNAYLKVDTSAGPGAGITGQTIQFHGTADRYTLNGATRGRDALLERVNGHQQSGGDAARGRLTAAKRPPSPTTSPARSSTPARATRPGPARSATACSVSVPTTCSLAPRQATCSRTGSTRARSRSRRPTSSSACSST